MVGGEALRYLYLEKQQMKTNHEPQQEHLVLLVLGDYLPRITRRQMALLEQAAPGFPSGLELWVKGHPACPIDPQQWPSLKIFIISDPLDKIVGRYQIVFTSNPTAAAVDVYLSGGKVVTMLDPDQFNMSPLRGYAGVDFVATPQELAQAVCRFCEHPKVDNEEAEGFFFTDQELPRWQRLLDLSCPLGKVESG